MKKKYRQPDPMIVVGQLSPVDARFHAYLLLFFYSLGGLLMRVIRATHKGTGFYMPEAQLLPLLL